MVATLALPLTLSRDGGFATVEQGSPQEITQSVALLLATRPGERQMEPDYGLPDPVGVGLDPTAVTAALREHEPRALQVDVDLQTIVNDAGITIPSDQGAAVSSRTSAQTVGA